jgi:tRNA pseudouridine55 synthase
MILSHSKQKHIDRLKVKLGHGGTLDPMATGVLIVGVGKGTKCLQRFLECTKTYECVILFGAATDSYDAVGKVVSKAPYEHVTKELVEENLAQFRGKIMQKPSVFSALKVDGKKMYEYAREGKDIPEVAARPVEVLEMELVEWLEPGAHEYAWPKEEAAGEEREGAEKLLGIRKKDFDTHAKGDVRRARKRSRSPQGDQVENAGEQPKRPRTDSEPAMSGGLPVEHTATETAMEPGVTESTAEKAVEAPVPAEEKPAETVAEAEFVEAPTDTSNQEPTNDSSPPPQPPAARIRMTVTSGFYVRSLCHDLGLACSSLGIMSALIRSRQGDYTLNDNVVEFSDLEKDPEIWEPKVRKQLEDFMEKEGWEAEELEDDEAWEEKKADLMKRRRENDRDTSYKGGNRGKGNWKGKGGGNYYSKNMNGGNR